MNLVHWALARTATFKHLVDAHADKLRLQDLLDQERAEKDWLREQLIEVTKSKEDILKMQVNICYQEKYGFRLYPETGGLPDDFVEARTKQQQAGTSRPARADGHAVAAKATADFIETYQLRKKQNEAFEATIREATKANNPVVVASN